MVTLRISEKRLFGDVIVYEGQCEDVGKAMYKHLTFYTTPYAEYRYEIITIHAVGGNY
jgi:hypothetical protein